MKLGNNSIISTFHILVINPSKVVFMKHIYATTRTSYVPSSKFRQFFKSSLKLLLKGNSWSTIGLLTDGRSGKNICQSQESLFVGWSMKYHVVIT